MRTRAWARTLVLCALPCFLMCGLAPLPARAQAEQATPSPQDIKKAQAFFKKGSALYAAKKFAAALPEFKSSYATIASPNSHLYIARCLNELGEHIDAYLEFDSVAEEAAARAATEPRYAKTQETALAERDDIGKKIALVTVTVNHPEAAASLRIGHKDVPRERWGKPFPVHSGSIEIALTSSGGVPATQNLTLAVGEKKEVALDALRSAVSAVSEDSSIKVAPIKSNDGSSNSRAGLRPYAYAAGGVGLAGFALFTVAGILTNSTYSDLSDSCDGPCPPERADDVDKGKTEQTLANVGLIVGAVGLAAGATLFVLSVTGNDTAEQQNNASIRLVLGPSYAGLHGTF